jgi:hypothetical protein
MAPCARFPPSDQQLLQHHSNIYSSSTSAQHDVFGYALLLQEAEQSVVWLHEFVIKLD